MRILWIEDNTEWAQKRIAAIEAESGRSLDVTLVSNRADAIEAIRASGDFDLLICDLSIPPHSNSLDESIAHGFDVFRTAGEELPGSPAIFLTSYPDEVDPNDDIGASPRVRPFGYEMARAMLCDKLNNELFIGKVTSLIRARDEARAVSITQIECEPPLDENEEILLQSAAVQVGATAVEVRQVSGVSGARALYAVFDSGSVHERLFLKIDSSSGIANEEQAYRRFVSRRLGVGEFADLKTDLNVGIGRTALSVYTYAAKYERNLFQVALDDDELGESCVERLREVLSAWDGDEESGPSVPLRDLRRSIIDDEALEALGLMPDIVEFEQQEVVGRRVVQHGDGHGGNVLVEDADHVMVIDYADVGYNLPGLDPVVLEQGFLFYPKSPLRNGAWPSVDQAGDWFDEETLLVDCPCPRTIGAVRRWIESSVTEVEARIVSYLEAMRQLKYPDTDKQLALGIVRSCIA